MSAEADEDEVELGNAGASARREYERRKANRERRIREKHPRLGGVILALQDQPAHEQNWARGAQGEERVERSLAKHLDGGVQVLHDRRIPGRRANIDHIAIAASGVWVIDAKRYAGQAEVKRPLFGEPKLLIGGRDQSRLGDGLAWQVELVRAELGDRWPGVPIQGALCFVDTELPLVRTLTFRGLPLLHPRRLAKRINHPGPVAPEVVGRLLSELAQAFPPA